MGILAQLTPLQGKYKLLELERLYALAVLLPGFHQSLGLAPAQRRWPLVPGQLPVLFTQGHEQHKIVEPVAIVAAIINKVLRQRRFGLIL